MENEKERFIIVFETGAVSNPYKLIVKEANTHEELKTELKTFYKEEIKNKDKKEAEKKDAHVYIKGESGEWEDISESQYIEEMIEEILEEEEENE